MLEESGAPPAFSARRYNLRPWRSHQFREPLRQRWAVNLAPGSRRLEMGDVLTLPSGKGRCNTGNCGTQLTGARYRPRLLHDEPYISHASDSPDAKSFTCKTRWSSEPGSRSSGEEQELGRGSTEEKKNSQSAYPTIFILTGDQSLAASCNGAAALEQ